MTLVGHRIAGNLAPENSLAAVDAAADYGLRWVELDVHLSQDGAPVVVHDRHVGHERLGPGAPRNGATPVERLTEAQLLERGVPSLSQVADALRRRGLNAIVELKETMTTAPALHRVQVELRGVEYLVSSFTPSILSAWSELPDAAPALVNSMRVLMHPYAGLVVPLEAWRTAGPELRGRVGSAGMVGAWTSGPPVDDISLDFIIAGGLRG